MRFITITFLCFLPFLSISQECIFLPQDTVVCGFKHTFQITEAEGTFYYTCEENKMISISDSESGLTMFSFSKCGDYEIIFESNLENCLDTFRIKINDPSNSTTSIDTQVDLGYGDIDCPDDVQADCFSDGVSIPINSGPPEEVWSFCTTASCQTTIYTTDVSGAIDGCLVDSISCDTIFITDSSEDCIETNQDAFIILNSAGDMVDNDTFLEYIAQLQSALNVECTPVFDSCFVENEQDCIDSTVIDTSYLHIPVRIGGKWTLANIDSVELFDTTYFEYFGRDYELILDPGVEFYGPGNLDVYLNEIFITSGNDTTRSFPYGFYLELQWEEDWIIDTLQLIREIPIDTDGDCFVCGGNFFNSGFNVPGIPEFPCGPIGINYPDICECEYQYPDYSIQLINCQPKQWQLDIVGGYFEIVDVYGAEYSGGLNFAYITEPTSENVTALLQDWNGCYYDIFVDLESIAEEVRIETNGPATLSCEVSSVVLDALVFALNNLELEFHEAPTWYLPHGGEEVGLSISATEPGTYRLEYEDELGCVHEDAIDIEYSDVVVIIDDYIQICGSGGVDYEGVYIDQPGEYTIEIDCNEFINLTVDQYDFQEFTESYKVCQGESINIEGQDYSAGNYDVNVQNGTPCPDLVHVVIEETIIEASWNVTQNCGGSASLWITHNGNGADYSISNVGNFSNNVNSLDVEIETSGIYEVEIETNGCTTNFSVDVELMEYEILPHEDALLTCANNCVSLNPEIVNLKGAVSEAEYSLLWNGPDGFSATDASIEICDSGPYTLNLTYGDGCTVSRTILVNAEMNPETQYIQADLCFGECYDDGTYTFCQTTQTTMEIDECNRIEVDVRIAEEISSERFYSLCEGESIEVNNISYGQNGLYEAVFLSESGCDSTLHFSIDILEPGDFGGNNIIDCQNLTAELFYTSSNEFETYIWEDEHGEIVSTEQSFSTSQTGIYYLEVIIEGEANTCNYSEEIEVVEQIVEPEILLEDTYTINCESTRSIDFNMASESTWTWDGPSGLQLENEILVAEEAGTYTVFVVNKEGCSASKSVEISLADPIEIDFLATATCLNINDGILELKSLTGGLPPYKIMLDEEEIDMMTMNLSAGEYMLNIEQADGCTYEQEIKIEAIPDLDEIPIQVLEFCNNEGITITLDIEDDISYKWLDGFEDEKRQIRQDGIYELELSNQCSSIISTYEIEDTRVENRFAVSNIFSPDGNSVNDKMKVVPNVEYEDFSLCVFSRDGSLVYHTLNPENGWDGKIGGNKVILGSYVWMIEASILDCEGALEKTQDVGTVMVIY